MNITIKGQPYSQKRHRTGRSGHRYDPSSSDKKAIQKALLPIKPTKPLTRSIYLVIKAYFQTPTTWSKNKAYEHENEFRPKSPDCDNIAKIIMDAMNGYIYEDDRQVVSLTVYKKYSTNPRTEIELNKI